MRESKVDSTGPSLEPQTSLGLLVFVYLVLGWGVSTYLGTIGLAVTTAFIDANISSSTDEPGNFGQFGMLFLGTWPIFLIIGSTIGCVPFRYGWIFLAVYTMMTSACAALLLLLAVASDRDYDSISIAIAVNLSVLGFVGLFACCVQNWKGRTRRSKDPR